MPLNMTKIAFGAKSWDDLAGWFVDRKEMRLTTRYQPKRFAEMDGGSLYWVLNHALVARSPILSFEQNPEGRWWINLEPKLIQVETQYKRAHQGWRYLEESKAPADLADNAQQSDVLPGKLHNKLKRLGLV